MTLLDSFMAKAKGKQNQSRSKPKGAAKKAQPKGPAKRGSETTKRRDIPFKGQTKPIGAIFIIAIMLLAVVATVIAFVIPSGEDEEKAFYKIEAFLLTENHTAERDGTSDFLLYLKNKGNRDDDFRLSVAGKDGLKVAFKDVTKTYNASAEKWVYKVVEVGQVSIEKGKSKALIVSVKTSSAKSDFTAKADIQIQSMNDFSVLEQVKLRVLVVESQGEPLGSDEGVAMWYTGTLTDGTLFDGNVKEVYYHSTLPHKEDKNSRFDNPDEYDGSAFELLPSIGESSVIQGWRDQIPGMKEGQTRVLAIKPEKAYTTAGNEKNDLYGEFLFFEVTAENRVETS